MKSLLGVMALVTAFGCGGKVLVPSEARDYRQEMRELVMRISARAKGIDPGFLVVPQNGHELLTWDGTEAGEPVLPYIGAIDGVGREELFYGYCGDDVPTPEPVRRRMVAFMDLAEEKGLQVLVTDYCSTPSFVDDSYARNSSRGYISFAADSRELDRIPGYPPEPYNVNDSDVGSLGEAKNFLYLINPGRFSDKEAFLDALRRTDYDILIIDPFYEDFPLSREEVESLKVKANGGSRLVIAYMSVGEAEDYRYYWNPDWSVKPPSWLLGENPEWPGNFKVRYWEEGWREVVYGYLGRVMEAGFDGAYLDVVDAFEYFEED